MKHYLLMVFIFLVFFASFNTEAMGVAPPTFGYIFCALVLVTGYLAAKRHDLKYIKTMFAVAITVQFVFTLAVPYWVLGRGMALNAAWPYFPELLWSMGSVALWYYIISFVFLPVIVYLYGRRAWCSFICGTGVLAETLGDPYRDRGPKGTGIPGVFTAIKWIILAATIAITVAALAGDPGDKLLSTIFLVVFILVIRTGIMNAGNIILMPKFGTRIWCKYFCPQGLLIALIARMGRFALVRDDARCAGCGTCDKNCSMSVNISGGPAVNRTGDCVGCGVCVEACPQGALSMTTGALPAGRDTGVEKMQTGDGSNSSRGRFLA